ncbi:MAG: PAS domain-containing protein, partial [Bacteroidota bacterium]
MIQDIIINEAILGQIEVCYPIDLLPATDQLFLPEESSLLFSIAVKLGNYIEKKEKELALKSSEEKYKDLIENISDVIYTTDNQGNIIFISPSITKLLGYRPEDIMGKNFSDFTGETIDHLKKRFENIKDVSGLHSEYQILSVTGEPNWIRFSSMAIFKEGQFIGVTGTLVDITEKKLIELELQKSESLYRNLVESINDIVYDITMDGTINYVSPAIERLFNLKAESLIGQNFFGFVHPEDQSFLLDIFQNNRFVDHKDIEYRCLTVSGEMVWVQASARNVYEEDQLVGRTGILHDITERKLTEEKLRKSEEQYRKLVES